MFRLVSHGVDKPSFLLLCDNIECGGTCAAEAITSSLNPIPIPQQELAFLEECKRLGWYLTMRLQLCPLHHRQVVEAARRSMVGPNGQVVRREASSEPQNDKAAS